MGIGVFSGRHRIEPAKGMERFVCDDIDDIAPLKRAARIMMVISALVVAAIVFPVARIMIRSYHLTPEMQDMIWQYGIGVLASLPLGLMSTICVYELTVLGKKEVLTWLAVTEGGVNLILDLVFVGAFHMGIAGAGWGTAAANLVRCMMSILYLSRKTDIYRCGGSKLRMEDIQRIFRLGSIDASFTAMMAVQSVIMLDETEETKELITNYALIKKVAASVRYQYLLNLNYTVITFV